MSIHITIQSNQAIVRIFLFIKEK